MTPVSVVYMYFEILMGKQWVYMSGISYTNGILIATNKIYGVCDLCYVTC